MHNDYTKTKQKSPWIKLTLGVMAILLILGLMPMSSFADETVPQDWEWYKYANNQSNNTVLPENSQIITNPKEADTKWQTKLGEGYAGAPTPPLISKSHIYVAVGSKVAQYSKKTGQETKVSKANKETFNSHLGIPGTVEYAMNPMLYMDGKFFIAITGGRIQCVDANTLKPLWATKYKEGTQNVSNISYAHINGKLFVYGASWKSETENGTFFAVNVDDGKVTKETVEVNGKEHEEYTKDYAWEFTPTESDKKVTGEDNKPRGFYWAGAYANEKYVVVGTDDGLPADKQGRGSSVYSLNAADGKIISKQVGLYGDIRTSICFNGSKIYFASKNGYLYRCPITEAGVIGKPESLKIGEKITATPVVYGDRIYVGVGGANQFYHDSGHGVAIIDGKNALTFKGRVATPGYPQATVTVAPVQKGNVNGAYVYTTYNNKPGGIFYFFDDLESTKFENAKDLYLPDHPEFCLSPISVDRDGTMYYKNDSSFTFAVKKNTAYLDGLNVSDKQESLRVVGRDETIDKYFNAMIRDYHCNVKASADSVEVKPVMGEELVAKISAQSVTPDKKTIGKGKTSNGEAVSIPLAKKGDTEITVRVEKKGTSDSREYKVLLTPVNASAVASHIGVTPKSTQAPWESGSKNKEANMSPEFHSMGDKFATTRNDAMVATDEMSLWIAKENPNSKVQVQPDGDDSNLDKATYDNDKESYPLVDAKDRGSSKAYRVYLKRIEKDKDAKVKVKVTSEDGKSTHEYNITIGVEIYAQSISLNKENIDLEVGKTEQLKVIFNPENTTTKDVKWKSGRRDIASVDDNGLVTAKKVGKATITATNRKSGKKANCIVNVIDPKAQEKYTVEFMHPDGKVEKPKEGNVFQTTSLDKGKFVLKKDGKVLSRPYFDAMVARHEGSSNWNNVWIAEDGTFQGFDVRKVNVKAYEDENAAMAEQVATTFTIDNRKSDLESLHAYVDGKEVSVKNPAKLVGSENGTVVFKGKLKGKDELVDIPYNALRIKSKDKNKGTIQGTNGVFDITTKNGNKEAEYTAKMDDGSGEVSFKAVVEKDIKLTGFKIDYPKTFYIENWNALSGDNYLGLIRSDARDEDKAKYGDKTYSISFTPENASNKKLNWVSNNPDIAVYNPTWGEVITPKKAGKATFTVTSEENPNLKQEVSIDFQYKVPLKSAEPAEKTIKMKSGETKDLKINANPENATEQRFQWSYTKEDGSQKDAGGLTLTSSLFRPSNDVPHTTTHSITANEDGIYVVTGTPMDTTGGAKPITFKVVVGEQKENKAELANSDDLNTDHHLAKTEDGNYIYTKNESTGLSLRIENTNPDRLTAVLMDDETLTKDTDYTVTKGSILLTLKKETLDKLQDGNHKLTVKTEDGDVEVPFVVKTKQQPAPADKTKLNEAITAAEKAKEGVEVSKDGADKDKEAKWVTEAEMRALDDAIKAAKEVQKEELTKDQQKKVDDAVAALNAAKDKFEAAKKAGTKKPAPEEPKYADLTDLNKAIEKAKAAVKDVKTSKDGKDIDKADKWVTPEAMKALTDKTAEAEKLAKSKPTEEKKAEVEKMAAELNKLTEGFKPVAGLKEEAEPTPEEPKYADLTDLNKAIEKAKAAVKDVKTSKDGKDIAKADKWVTPEAMKALTDKTSEAEKLAKSKPTEDKKTDVDKMTADLNKLTEGFKPVAGLKEETKPDPGKKPDKDNSGKTDNGKQEPSKDDSNKGNIKPGNDGKSGNAGKTTNETNNKPDTKPAKTNSGHTAKTGDDAMTVGYGMIAVILAGATYFVVRRRKNL